MSDSPDIQHDPASAALEDAGSQALAEALRSSFFLVKGAMIILAVLFLCSGVFTVRPQEKAVILRFGKPVGAGEAVVRGPGLHWAFPYPIDEVIKIPAAQIQTATSTVGWYFEDPKLAAAGVEPPLTPSLKPAVDGYALSGDGNIIHARATIRYRVTDPVRYYFGFANTPALVTNALNCALVRTASRFTVDDALRRNLEAFKERVLARFNEIIQAQELGISLEPSEVITAPPRQVREAFEAVLAAENERSKTINDAQGYANSILSKAKGEATALLNAGQTDKTRLVEGLNAEARYFNDLLPQYRRDPELFRQRLQVETLARVLVNAQDKFFLPERADGKPRELRLQLGREPMKAKPPAAAATTP